MAAIAPLIEELYAEWVRQGRTGTLELHFVDGELRKVYSRAVIEFEERAQPRPAPVVVRR